MAPSPVISSSGTSRSNPRRQSIPVVPAIPRSLERKSRQPAGPVVEAKADVKSPTVIAAASEARESQKGDPEIPDVKDEVVGEETETGKEGNSKAQENAIENHGDPEEEVTELDIVVDNKDYSPQKPEDFGIEKHGFKLPPPFSPKKSPPAAISTSFALEGELPRDDASNRQGQPWDTVQGLPVRPAASTFHAHPTPPSEITDTTFPTAPSSKGNDQGQSFSYPQPTPPTDVTTSPTHPQYQQFSHQGHAHNLSFHAPPPLSSNGTASPARSTHHGPAYHDASYAQAYPSYGYPSHDAHAHDQPPHSSQHGASDSVLSAENYRPHGSFNYPSAYAAPGSQPPFEPSAMPFDNLPPNWRNPISYPPPQPWEHGYPLPDASMAHPDSLRRSTSPSTMKSDGVPLGHEQLADNGLQSSPDDSFPSNPLRSTRLSSSRGLSSGSPNDQASLIGYLLENFNNAEYADCELTVQHKHDRFPPTTWYLSGFMISQSPTLRYMLRQTTPANDGKRHLSLKIHGRFITPSSAEAALRFCYGEPTTLFTGVSPHEPDHASNEELSLLRMSHCLNYAGSGILLGLNRVMLRGLEVAFSILNWENLEAAFSFGLQTVEERSETALAPVLQGNEGNAHIVAGAERNYLRYDGDRRPSSDALFTPPSQKNLDSVSGLSPPDSNGRAVIGSPDEFFKHCLRFVKENFPDDWQLDVKARPLADIDRLPVTKNPRSPLSSSRLGHIQFGQMPSEAEKNSANPDVLISTIVLSVTFDWLDFLLKTMGEPIRRNLAAIVEERERRRHAALQSDKVTQKNRMVYDAFRWSQASFEESVLTSDDGTMSLSRRYAGVGCDPKSESSGS